MAHAAPLDDSPARSLPLPLARLYRRAHNAKTALERHQAAYYLWEAALKLLGCVAVVSYAERPEHDPELAERLQNLARPALGHWWEFVRRLLPVLADSGDLLFAAARDLVLGRARDDLPRAAGLDAALREALEGKGGARSTVRLSELFDRLVGYRNHLPGHGAVGMHPESFYERMGLALLAGVGEVLGKLDVLAGRRLLYVAEVRQAAGVWLVQRYELAGESARRIESLELPRSEAPRLPDVERLYLEAPAREGAPAALRSLHPLLTYDAEAEEVLFLNARRGKKRAEYLSYTTGRVVDRPDLGGEQRQLLARVLGMPVGEGQAAGWAERSRAEEPPEGTAEGAPRRQAGEFELLSELGRGGMGKVYRAWQPSLGRQVALKELLCAGDARTEARFAREIRALGRVEHPNLVKIFTSGSEGDHWFYAMELIEGTPLAAVCDRLQTGTAGATDVDLKTWQDTLSAVYAESRRAEKPLSDARPEDTPPRPPAPDPPRPARPSPLTGRGYVRHVVELVRQVAEAADALHEAGIVHRDIKPGNIMVTADGSQAVLMDLGLAQIADDVEGRLTRTRQFVGTLRYASPEQVLAVGRLDRRSDVYSLGATLWELLTLRPLYGATEQTPTPELMQRIQYEEPERVRKHHRGIPRDLEAIVHRCLEKDPRRRYPAARDLAEDLRRFLAGEPVQARPIRGWERGLRWVRRRPAEAALLGVSFLTVLALAAGGVGLFYNTRLQDANRRLADSNARLQEAVAERDQQRHEAEREWRRAEEQQRRRAQAERRLAEQQRAEALRERARAARQQYSADMGLAQRAWEEGRMPLLLEILERHQPSRQDDEDLRGFEWYYLWRLCHSELLTLRGHTSAVVDVSFTPDGKHLASAGRDHTVKLWDATTGDEVLTLRGHSADVLSVCFSPDGGRLASADKGGAVKLWDPAGGKLLRTLTGHTSSVNHLAFGPDGRRLASAGEDWTVKLWDTETGKRLHSLLGHVGGVNGVAFSPDGRRLASAGDDQTVKLWDALTGKKAFTLKGHRGAVRGVAFSPDGRELASAGDDHTVKLWDAATGKVLHSLTGHANSVSWVTFNPDGKVLASAGQDQTVRVWDAATGKELRALKGHTGGVWGVAFSPRGGWLASASQDQTVKVWDLTADHEALSLQGHRGEVYQVAFSPDGQRVASAGKDGRVKLWETSTGLEVASLAPQSESLGGLALRLLDAPPALNGVVYSPDGKWLACAGDDQTVTLWDAATGKEAHRLTGHTASVWSVCFSPDGGRLASADKGGAVKLWDPAGGKLLRTLTGHTDAVNGLAFSPDGRRLASASDDWTVKLWDTSTGKQVSSLAGHTNWVRGVAFSPDGKRLASAGYDRTVKLWDWTTGLLEVHTLRGHTGNVQAVAFSPDGKRLASASYDRTVKLWDVSTGQEVLSLRGHDANVWGVAFSPDGKALASAGQDGSVKVWDATVEEEAVTFRGHTRGVKGVAFSPRGPHLASGGKDYVVKVWDWTTGRVVHTLRGHTNWVNGVASGPDGKRLASGGDRTVRVWDVTAGEERLRLKGHTNWVLGVAFSPDGKTLASAGEDRTVKIWGAATGKPIHTLPGHTDWVRGLAFSPDGKTLASGSGDWTVRLWDVASGEGRGILKGHTKCVTCVAFGPDGKRLASAGYDGTVRVWDVRTGKAIRTLKGHTGNVWGLAFSPDGRRLASAGYDRTVRVWDPDTGEEVLTLRGHDANVWGVAFSPDGKALASASEDGTVKLWDPEGAKRNALLARRLARAVRGRAESADVWALYALARLQTHGPAGYRQVCADMLRRFGRTEDPQTANDVAYTCALLPGAMADPAPVVRLAEKAVAKGPRNWGYLNTLGTALYRAGRFDEAVKRLDEAVKLHGKGGTVFDWLPLAMAHQRLGHPEEAKKWLRKAVAWIDRPPQAGPEEDLWAKRWDGRLQVRLLRREAEALLEAKARE